MPRNRLGRSLLTLAGAVLAVAAAQNASAGDKFSFGVMSDTQWKANLDGKNPNTVAVGIIDQLNQEFIRHGVTFVIQVGDLTDNGSAAGMQTRADAAKALYDAGIGFFPLRGNHESSQAAALQFQTLYPQTIGQGDRVVGASGFTSPMDTLKGLSYSFDYGDAHFVLLDQFTRTDGTGTDANTNIIDQLSWIGTTLQAADRHAFVFAHKGLITEDHVDVLFGADPSKNPAAQNTFLGSLSAAGVRYFFGGHDHMHNRSLILSPDAASTVQDIIAASDSYKFYTPAAVPNDVTYDVPAFGFTRETPLAQELYTVGYYIVTVDGPRVTVDHYASSNGCGNCDLTVTPALTFTRRDTFGYSLNGREFLVRPGESYTVVADEHGRTSADILDGTYASSVAVADGRPVSHLVTTGWSHRECGAGGSVLHLWGMATAMGSDQTDPYVLSMTYDPRHLRTEKIGKGGIGLVAKAANGRWENAVALNSTGKPTYVKGPYRPGYALGTYGVDPAHKTAWAVIDHTNTQFTVTNLAPVKNCR